MPLHSGLAALAEGAILSPFTRLRRLLNDTAPGHANPIDLTIGEPRGAMPPFVAAKLMEAVADYGRYPPIRGTQALRSAIAAWAGRRYGTAATPDPTREVLALNGSREGLFLAALPAAGRKQVKGRAAVLMCNPYYSAYIGGALAVDAEPVYLNATAATGHLPDLDAIAADQALLDRTVALYLCSPANPQGAVASEAYIARALELARAHDFMLFFDECYSEIYTRDAPPGGLEIAAATPDGFRNIIVFNSLSKRSNLPGLRSGFIAGDGGFLDMLAEIRNQMAPQMPGVVQHASAAAWSDEQHVAEIRKAYRAKFDVCDALLGGRFAYQRPDGGFFLWLDVSHMGGSEKATLTIWKRCGVKVIPGAFLAQEDRHGVNPGRDFVRVALVHDVATVREALERVVKFSA